MNEGAVSTRLGLDGTPGIAEEVMIARDILLAEYTGGHIHVAHISTKEGVELVRQGKAKGIKVTTEVCPHHFDLTDEEIDRQKYSTNFKMHPPLRTQEDVDAMIEGLVDGTIDVICTDHAYTRNETACVSESREGFWVEIKKAAEAALKIIVRKWLIPSSRALPRKRT